MTIMQADREVAATFAVLTEMREIILAGRADHYAEPIARHRLAAEQAALRKGIRMGIEAARKWAEDDAKLCDCFAHSESECACGAWCEWKTVPMHRVVEAIRALDVEAIAKKEEE